MDSEHIEVEKSVNLTDAETPKHIEWTRPRWSVLDAREAESGFGGFSADGTFNAS